MIVSLLHDWTIDNLTIIPFGLQNYVFFAEYGNFATIICILSVRFCKKEFPSLADSGAWLCTKQLLGTTIYRMAYTIGRNSFIYRISTVYVPCINRSW